MRGYNVMKGYFNNPEATRAAITADGWLHTGDEASIDERGLVRITGRIKDIIIRGGENISPKEIEDCLREHPAVADAYVYGLPDAILRRDRGGGRPRESARRQRRSRGAALCRRSHPLV